MESIQGCILNESVCMWQSDGLEGYNLLRHHHCKDLNHRPILVVAGTEAVGGGIDDELI